MKIFYLSISILFAPFFALAEPTMEIPVLSGEQGGLIQASWKDGREATAIFGATKPLVLEVPLTIYENSCNEILTNKCKFITGGHSYRVHFKWTKHSNPQKIGTALRFRPKEATEYSDLFPYQSVLMAVDRVRYPHMSQNVPEDEFVCEDYSFLPKDPFLPPALHILNWEREIMLMNPETGSMENRSIGGALDIELVPQANRHLKLKVIGGYTAVDFLVSGDVVNLTLRDKNNGLCQIGIKPNFASVTTELTEYFTNPKEEFSPYDRFTDEAFLLIFKAIKNIVQHPENFEVEP